MRPTHTVHSPLPALRTAAALLLLTFSLHETWGASPAAPAESYSPSALVERGEFDMRTDPEASRRDAEAALVALQRQPDPDLEIRARLLLCDYETERDLTAAAEQVRRANALLPLARRPGLRGGILTCEGELNEAAGENARALALFNAAVAAASSPDDDEMLAGALFSRGYLFGLQGTYTQGLADLKRAQSLYDHLRMPRHALTALDSIAILYNRMGDFAEARHIYEEALAAQRAAGMLREQAVTSYNLGRTFESLRSWQEARRCFNDSLELSRRIGYVRGEAYALRGLGAADNAVGNPAGALVTLAHADTLQGATPDARLHAQILLERGKALHRLKHLPESRAALLQALSVFAKADALGELVATNAELASVAADLEDWQAAYASEGDYARYKQRLLADQLDQRFETLKVQFDTAAKEKENASLLRENAADRNALAQARSVRRLQATVIGLTVLLAILLATLAIHQRGSTQRMRSLAMTDELTGVPNRRAVLGRLSALLEDPARAPCSILIIDIDHFKSINDHHGHSVGDEVLKVIAEEVRATVSDGMFFGRLGGEEFLIVFPDAALARAAQLAERFRERILTIDTARWFADRRNITASVGVTVTLEGAETPSSMLKRADAALYAAKRAGRNCVRTEPAGPEPEVDPHAASRMLELEPEPGAAAAEGSAKSA